MCQKIKSAKKRNPPVRCVFIRDDNIPYRGRGKIEFDFLMRSYTIQFHIGISYGTDK